MDISLSESCSAGGARALDVSLGSDAKRLRLWLRIVRRLPVSRQVIIVGPQTFEIAYIPDENWACCRLEEAARLGQENNPRWQPFWIWPWESAQALAAYVIDLPIVSKSVLDLGCGLGLVGTVAASCGAQVVLVDAVPEALLVARWNSWPWRRQVRCRRLDWQRETLNTRFDWIFGADILYSCEDWPHLDRFWRRHLTSQGSVLLTEPNRPAADPFVAWARQQGWSVQELPHWRVRQSTIRFFQLRLP